MEVTFKSCTRLAWKIEKLVVDLKRGSKIFMVGSEIESNMRAHKVTNKPRS